MLGVKGGKRYTEGRDRHVADLIPRSSQAEPRQAEAEKRETGRKAAQGGRIFGRKRSPGQRK